MIKRVKRGSGEGREREENKKQGEVRERFEVQRLGECESGRE